MHIQCVLVLLFEHCELTPSGFDFQSYGLQFGTQWALTGSTIHLLDAHVRASEGTSLPSEEYHACVFQNCSLSLDSLS